MKGRRRWISHTMAPLRGFLIFCVIFLLLALESVGQQYHQETCSNRLENALEHMRRRSGNVKSSRSLQTPYDIYYSLYGQQNEPFEDSSSPYYSYGNYIPFEREYRRREYYGKNFHENKEYSEDENFWQQNARQRLTVSRVDVEDLKVRMPAKREARWVDVDKCKFSAENATLDTRLIFPDLTISGRVILQPTGGKCNMILRLRHAGIEFHTTPIGFDITHNEQLRRLAPATVRTESHFSEPGFISVFAHGCKGPSGIRIRQNSKRRFGFTSGDNSPPDIELSEPHIIAGSNGHKRWGKRHQVNPNYDIRNGLQFTSATGSRVVEENLYNDESRDSYDDYQRPGEDNFYRDGRRFKRNAAPKPHSNDEVNFNDDILNFSDESLQDIVRPDARAFSDLLNGDEMVGDALSGELEKIFSMGVRGLLTTYMQRALQPAIKETLMENMGYRLSYG